MCEVLGSEVVPASYLSRHRPICSVLQDIRMLAVLRNDEETMKLCDEAITYAQSMSAKLTEYKEAEYRVDGP